MLRPRAGRREWLLVWVPGALLALSVLVPIGTLAAELLSDRAARAVVSVLFVPETWLLLGRSAALAAGVTALAVALGVPLGVLLGRTDVHARGWLLAAHAFPMFVPPFLIALGWFHVVGSSGLLGSAGTARLFFGAAGVVVVQALTFTPIVTALTALALQNVDPSLEEAGRVVARPARVVVRLLLPTAWPAVGLAMLLVFALALSELAVPMFLRVRTYPASVLARLGGVEYAPGEAVALTLPLLAVTFGLLALERRIVAEKTFAVLGLRRDRPILRLGHWRTVATVGSAAIALLSLVPVAALVGRAAPDGFAAAPAWIRSSLWTSLRASTTAATLITALGLGAAWAFARGRRGGRALDATLLLGFLTPAAVLGTGLIAVWNTSLMRPIYGGTTILVLGLVARYAVVGVRVMATAVAQSPRSLEETAAVFGAGPFRQLRRIVAPLHVRGIAAAWLLAIVFCVRDLDTVVLFYPPGLEPLTVRIFTLEANGPEAVVAALAVTQIAVTAALLGAAAAAAHHWRTA
jgi:iron(III) transport system permease protein